MISKTKLKEFAAYRMQKRCDEEGVFVVEGPKLAREALLSGADIKAVCCTDDWYGENQSLVGEKVFSENIFVLTEPDLERLSQLRTPNKVWMLVNNIENEPFENSFETLTLVLDKIQDPGNLGTIIRIADWFGIRHLVCSKDTVNCFNAKVVQSTMGGIFRTSLHYVNLEEYLGECRKRNIPVYGALLSGDSVYTADLQQNGVLVIGNESKGISETVQKFVSHKISIPNFGGTCESLNASVATGIVCSEFFRRK